MNNYKKDFSWFKNNKDMVFFDSAAGSLKPDCVIKEVEKFYYEQSTNPHNDDSIFAHKAKEVMENCRRKVAKLINSDDQEIIFTSGATESLMLISQSIKKLLKKGDEVVLSRIEHASNLLPWYQLRDEIGIKLKFIKEDKLTVDYNDLKNILNEKTKVVAITGGSNLTGIIVDIDKVAKIVKNYNKEIILCVDAAQRIVHEKCDVKSWDADFLAFSGNKIFAPTGIGVCYIKEKYQNLINPLKYGGGMNSTINENEFCYIDGVEKFEGGTPNVAGIYGLNKAMEYMLNIGYENIRKIEKSNWMYFKKLYEEYKIKDLEWINIDYVSSTFIFNIKGIFPQDLASYLGSKGIIVRSGLSCAKLMKDVVNVAGVVRMSTSIYNDFDDIKKVFEALKDFKKEDILNGII